MKRLVQLRTFCLSTPKYVPGVSAGASLTALWFRWPTCSTTPTETCPVKLCPNPYIFRQTRKAHTSLKPNTWTTTKLFLRLKMWRMTLTSTTSTVGSTEIISTKTKNYKMSASLNSILHTKTSGTYPGLRMPTMKTMIQAMKTARKKVRKRKMMRKMT